MTVLDKIEALSDDLKVYFNTNVELVKLQALDRSSSIGAGVIAGFIIGTVALMFLLFLSIGAAMYLSEVLGTYYYGFGAVAGFYLIVGLILLASKQGVVDSMRDVIIRTALKKDSNTNTSST